MRSRTPLLVIVAGLSTALLASACSSGGGDQAVVTVTSRVTAGPGTAAGSDTGGPSAPSGDATGGTSDTGRTSGNGDTTTNDATSTASDGTPPTSGGTPEGSATTDGAGSSPAGGTTTSPGSGGDATGGATAGFDDPKDGVALPDGFVPHKLAPGDKPPQFVVVSFDGVGWDEKWDYWLGIADQVPFRFTGFLSGTYMLSDQTKMHYHPPFYDPGTSEINWNSAADLPVEIENLNRAVDAGMEIGTHFNGHFCAGAGLPSGGNTWTTADWNTELDQFFALLKDYRSNNPDADLPKLKVKASDIKGERTPCLEGTQEALYPAMKAHGMIYDSSFTRRGISWPKQSPQYKIWGIGMAEYPIHGTLPDTSPVDPSARSQHVQITMDYNFWYSQEGATDASPEQSKADSEQVLNTYRDMYADTFNGNRAPLILGNHFNSWNHNAYSDAIGNFVLETCGKPHTQCVPFRDLIAWMKVQDPARLAELQNLPPELGDTG